MCKWIPFNLYFLAPCNNTNILYKWNIHISLSPKCHLLSNQRWNIGFDKVSSYNSHQACYTAWSCRVPEWLCVEVWQGHPSGGNKDPSHRCHILHKHNHNVRVKPSPYCVKDRMENLVLLYLELHCTQMYNKRIPLRESARFQSSQTSYFPRPPLRESARF